ncbi:cystathionine beta-lyase PatB [Thermoclostridium stercorarium subsp. stercorarium DSM 8532]|uniref:cysteine-S-conjugate beta-lyase n=4 Tax=Thermoclostridium stercorarium TaxID=1510 RepID=L7VK95_THES1|nr:aminotransferase class I/II-fold pyridoxal phosphate-dependent enzyme [Thermoclostridium stercorarium]AGC67084.1 cystathionine beta-lyase PatB [Thermoclostridium stercorarium subsp. stercorarium DSM 8532]AGI38167.1 beta-cystathionase [Thermoclostridium stercorarium subsp. stercorarium DSM 8532]ANW97573.1 cystathionine beta-lyase PatB [Thermoclostridium stercorarium subsp. thermolacticum DSM 2910]ANX00132.1 cystathionine beta-lyase PatB [Thermoclostridium stercorarium subsp. leptospartum DSM 
MRNFDFETLADAQDVDLGTDYNPDLIVLSGAQLHLKTAPCVIEALIKRAASGLYGWTASDRPAYINAVKNWMKEVRAYEIKKEWIVPSYGTLKAISTSIRAFTDENDGIIVQPPVYVLYSRVITNARRRIVYNPLIYRNGYYEMDFENLEYLMARPENKMMILCNPHNPIMDIWEEEELKTVARLAKKYNVLVVADEIYAEHVFYGNRVTPYSTIPEAADNCIVCTSIGKSFNFTGTSHSNIIIPNEEIRKKYVTQRDAEHYGSLDPFMYTAVVAAYSREGKEWIDALINFVTENIEKVKDFFSRYLPDVTICRHRAGTLLWADFNKLGLTEEQLHDFLTNDAGILMDRGSQYGPGGEGFCRFQVGIPRSELETALERLLEAGKRRGIIK